MKSIIQNQDFLNPSVIKPMYVRFTYYLYLKCIINAFKNTQKLDCELKNKYYITHYFLNAVY